MDRLLRQPFASIATVVLTLLAAAAFAPAAHAELQAGAATSNITPDIGGEIIGGFVPFPSVHIHDDLHARTLVLDDGKTRIALVVCDLLGIDRVVSELAREQIAKQHQLPRENVLISATHTHSATSALGKHPRKLEQPADDYQRFVAKRIADGVGRAIQNLRPAEIGFGTAEAPEHVFNRRWHMKPGTVPLNPFGGIDMVKMNPPRGNENLVEPAGPTDPTVSFLSVRDRDGVPIAVYAAYSLHYVGGVGRGHVSADYFAVFSEQLKSLLSREATLAQTAESANKDLPPFVAMIANGTSGDINNIDFLHPQPRKAAYEQIRHVGEDVAAKVHAALSSVKYSAEAPLATVYREPTIAWRKLTEEETQWAKETLAAGRKSERDLSYIYAERATRMMEYPETTTAPLHVLRIGDTCIGTMPFEVFSEIGLEFKKRCPLPNGFMVELAHGYFGYLPTPRQHRLGGYETWLGTNRVERDASTKLLNELLEMAKSLK
ncbi:MAG: neutral/alkaline non-lysosomal ceramidase N-terminal domain-containing protein [Planctomycetales bacterium]|nr:neutral/alkaline non-lysosomal ceramidase N-terminal domain-containing protein [Planctomycetales bacterium]